jgi:uncharacterized damage-inducible protein DinB
MKRYVIAVAVFTVACAAQAPQANQAPPANPLVTEAKGSYTNVKNNILKAAEKMPEENYSFSPTKEERPFSQVVAHIADSNTRSCALVKGEQRTPDAESKKTKADLGVALKASFDLCDAAFDSLTDASAAERITAGRGQRSRLSIMWGNTGHDMEQYAILSGYMRQKGLVPPSSEPRK